MKLKYTLITIIILSFSVLSFAKALRVYYFHRPPYYETLADGAPGGFLIKICTMILEDASIDYELIEAPPKRILQILRSEVGSCSVGWFSTSEREELYLFSQSIYEDQENVFVIRKELFPAETEVDIRDMLSSGREFTIVDGFSYGDWYDQKIDEVCRSVRPINSIPLNIIKMIAHGRTDYTIVGREEALWIIGQNPDIKEKVTVLTIKDAPPGNRRHIIFHKDTDINTVERINDAIIRVKDSDAYRSLIDQYE